MRRHPPVNSPQPRVGRPDSMALWGRLSGGNAPRPDGPILLCMGLFSIFCFWAGNRARLTHHLTNHFAPALCGNLRDLAVDDMDTAVGAGSECWIVGHDDHGLASVCNV